MSYVHLEKLDREGYIASVVLDRPEVRNAFNTEMADQLLEVFELLGESNVRVILLSSSNSQAFCSGADLKDRDGMTEIQWRQQHELFEKMFNAIADAPQPVIAVVDGYALAGGFEMILNCDIIVASRNAKFGLPEVTRGIMPGCGGSRLLAKYIGVNHAKEWICTGNIIGAERANEAGLINRLTEPENLFGEAMEIAEKIAQNAPLAVRNCKLAVDELLTLPKEKGREQEIYYYNLCVNTDDRLEGVRAFVEKRLPNFSGK